MVAETSSILLTRTARALLLTASALLSTESDAQAAPVQVRYEPGCEGLRAYFSTSIQGTSYAWDFGDGASSTEAAPWHYFANGPETVVTLVVITASGDTLTYTNTVPDRIPADLTDLQMPSVFTPNGDGINDVFSPITERSLGPCSELSVYDRYGHLHFRTQGNSIRWDGRTMAGEAASSGVYFYVYTVNDLEFTGHITLLR